MLFAAIYRTTNTTEEAQQRSLQLFTSWQPPVDFKAHYALADGSGGIAILETDDAAAVLEAVAPFTPFFDFEVTPIARDRAGRAGVREDTGVARLGRLRPLAVREPDRSRRELDEQAERVREPHLPDGAAVRVEQARRATRYARHFAREIATFSRLRENRKSRPRGTSSALELAIE